MARSRGGPSRAAAPRPRAASPPPQQRASSTHAAPPPAPAQQHAPPPAAYQSGGGGGMMSGLMGSLVTGAAMGTGSAVAHRAVDSLMGPRTVHTEAAPLSATSEPMQQQQQAQAPTQCAEQAKGFAECMSRSGGDMGACQYYFDLMQQCKTQTSYA